MKTTYQEGYEQGLADAKKQQSDDQREQRLIALEKSLHSVKTTTDLLWAAHLHQV